MPGALLPESPWLSFFFFFCSMEMLRQVVHDSLLAQQPKCPDCSNGHIRGSEYSSLLEATMSLHFCAILEKNYIFQFK